MSQVNIFYPVNALIALTFFVLLQIPITRMRLVKQGKAKLADFKIPDITLSTEAANRNLTNLLQLPILFYIISFGLFITKNIDIFIIILAWFYVILRYIHSYIHITYNDVYHRFIIFASSNIILMIMWIIFVFRL